jgi:HEAT repeat protein
MREQYRSVKQRRAFERARRFKSAGDVPGLIHELDHSDDSVTCFLAMALAELGDSRAVDPLVRRMRGIDLTGLPETDTKAAWALIAEALGKLAQPGSPAADELLAALEQPVGDEHLDAMDALATMGDERAIEPLLRRLHSQGLGPSGEILEWQYLTDALGRLKAFDAVDVFIEALAYPYLAEGAATALGQIGDQRAVPALAELLETIPSDRVGEAILEALTAIGTPDALAAADDWRTRGIALPPDQY